MLATRVAAARRAWVAGWRHAPTHPRNNRVRGRRFGRCVIVVTGEMFERIEQLSGKLHVTTNATNTLLRIVGEQTHVPDEKRAEVLFKVAND
jgi:hypothetical protein